MSILLCLTSTALITRNQRVTRTSRLVLWLGIVGVLVISFGNLVMA
ncbi:hypothetical protein [Actinopolyspora mortivallis]|nr:hypothetical protein [Actinopolyspora mortivallis]